MSDTGSSFPPPYEAAMQQKEEVGNQEYPAPPTYSSQPPQYSRHPTDQRQVNYAPPNPSDVPMLIIEPIGQPDDIPILLHEARLAEHKSTHAFSPVKTALVTMFLIFKVTIVIIIIGVKLRWYG